MNWVAALRSALRALGTNWLRSILTMLGIIIGVGAVITMLAAGAGAQKRIDDQIAASAPAMCGAAIDVPSQVALIDPRSITVSWYLLPGTVERIFTPGAATSTVFLPQFEKSPSAS